MQLYLLKIASPEGFTILHSHQQCVSVHLVYILAVGHTLTMFSHDCLFLRLVPLVFPNLLERHLDEGPPYQAHFSLITSLKALSQI